MGAASRPPPGHVRPPAALADRMRRPADRPADCAPRPRPGPREPAPRAAARPRPGAGDGSPHRLATEARHSGIPPEPGRPVAHDVATRRTALSVLQGAAAGTGPASAADA